MPKNAHIELFPQHRAPTDPLPAWETVQRHLRGWHSLHAVMHSKKGTAEMLRALLESEALGRKRKLIMRRIIGRLTTLERNRLCKLLKITTP